jgi:Fur family transcriptional regulator, ferric uptake regulator
VPGRSRHTRQLEAIRRAFARARRPLAPGEVLGLARREVSSLGLATVYRTIRVLIDERWLRVVELPGTPDRYEVAGKEHHHHFHCRACDGVFEVEGCPGGFRALAPGGFRLERHELVLYGVCRECAS